MPEGAGAVGWRVGVYWRDDQKFYMGEIAAYNEEDDEYEMNYDDSKPPLLLFVLVPLRSTFLGIIDNHICMLSITSPALQSVVTHTNALFVASFTCIEPCAQTMQ